MLVTCTCGETFEARNAKARYCSDRCRKRKDRGLVVAQFAEAPALDSVESSTRSALAAVGRLDSPLGQVAIALARRLDRPGLDTGSALASVAGRLESVLGTLLKGTGAATAPTQLRDELAERRRRHGA